MKEYPPRFIERMKEILPKGELDAFFENATRPIPKTIRIASKSKLAKRHPASWKLSPVAEIPEAFFITREDQTSLPLGKTLEHFTGEMYIASLSSLLAVHVLDPQPNEKILDIAAAPGSKSTFIADRMEHTGVLAVNEPSSSRSSKLAANLERMGVKNCVLFQNDGTLLDRAFGEEFDRILLDAPCSSEGFGRKDADYFEKMWSERKIFEAAKLQKKLIVSAFHMLAPGGTMLYSTCTSAPEENEAVVQYLLDKYPESVEILPIDLGSIPHRKGVRHFFEQEMCSMISENVRRIFPHLTSEKWDSEIFFLALITKKTPLDIPPPDRQKRGSFSFLSKERTAKIFSHLSETFGIDEKHFENCKLVDHSGKVFLTTEETAEFALHHPHKRIGLPMLDQNGYMTSSFAFHFGTLASKNTISLTEEEKRIWLRGSDIIRESSMNTADGEEVLVKFEDFCLGWGKSQNHGTKIKNKLDRALVFQ